MLSPIFFKWSMHAILIAEGTKRVKRRLDSFNYFTTVAFLQY